MQYEARISFTFPLTAENEEEAYILATKLLSHNFPPTEEMNMEVYEVDESGNEKV
jgi:hypothetical protein